MQKLGSTSVCPAKGYKIIVPQTGVPIHHWEYASFISLYLNHLRERGLPIWPGWEEELQDELCRQNPHWKGICQEVNPVQVAEVSNGDVRAFLTSVGRMVEHLIKGEEVFVSQEEAERRAAICVACEKNSVTVNWCPNCPGSVVREVKKWRDRFKGKSRDLTSSQDDKLLACKVCKCANSTQIHLSQKILSSVKHQGDYPSNCWKICNSPNSSSP